MMSDNDIRKEFQSKFNDFEVPVPANAWESVERSLKAATATRKVLHRRWYAGSVAAVLVLLIGGILFMRNPMEQTGIMVLESGSTPPLAGNTPDSRTETIAATESFSEPIGRTEKSGQLFAARTPVTPKTGKVPAVSLTPAGEMIDEWLEREGLQTQRAEKEGNAIRQVSKLMQRNAAQNDKKLLAEETIIVGGDDGMLFAEVGSERGEGTLLLAVSGRGGLSGYQQTVNSPMTLRSAAVTAENKYQMDAAHIQARNDIIAENISEVEHDQPVSFGITVSKYLFDDLSIETGLIYSYLHSKTRNTNNNFQVEEVQKLHYLGIPLNLNYNFLSLNGLNVYASVGGIVEKDVYGEFRKIREGQSVSFSNMLKDSEEKETVKISQRNPQISVNAGVGLSYPLYDKLRLYGKIGGAYYFDAKNEYKTIYSDRKIVMDLNVGLRYEF